jgi:3-hydroxy-D-aspartate aldolase
MPQPAPAQPGMPLADVDTPALIVDLDAFERNLRTMADHVAKAGVKLRPHAKTHKSPIIGLKQMALGAVGLCCQKVSEAEAMVQGGIPDVYVSNEVVGARKLERLAGLARQARVMIAVDNEIAIDQLAAAARKAGSEIRVLVEINVGANRCGVEPGEPAFKLAQQIHLSKHLRFAGLQAYQGGAQHMRKTEERRAAIEAACEKVKRTTALLAQAGITCERVTGAGTGSYMFEAASNVYHELQAGSYIFMDADYAKNDWTESGIPRFEHSLFIWTSVMSTPTADRAICDAGIKASSVDSGMPRVFDTPGAEYIKASDEHGVLKLTEGTALPLGHKLKIVPGHCDPTVNLYDHYVCVRKGRVEALWRITARGAVL